MVYRHLKLFFCLFMYVTFFSSIDNYEVNLYFGVKEKSFRQIIQCQVPVVRTVYITSPCLCPDFRSVNVVIINKQNHFKFNPLPRPGGGGDVL